MPLRKAKGNTFPDVDWLWSPLACGCQHQCVYCYAKANCLRFGRKWGLLPHWASENFRRVGKETDPVWRGLPKLPNGTIFVCDTNDLFADNIPSDWVETILEHCWQTCVWNGETEPTEFVFLTKNPATYNEFNWIFERFVTYKLRFGITLETNRDTSKFSKAVKPFDRANTFGNWIHATQYESFVSLEPIMDFDESEFLGMIEHIKPDEVYIGGNSQKCNLPEPDQAKLISFIDDVRKITGNVILKYNLKRLMPETWRIEKCLCEIMKSR